MKTKTFASLLALCTAALLAGCDTAVEKTAEMADDGEMRASFVNSCGESAFQAASTGGNSPITQAKFTELCGCAYDETAKTYPDATAWKKAIISYGMSQNDPELEGRLQTAMQTCAPKVLQN